MEAKNKYLTIQKHLAEELEHYVDQDGRQLESFGPYSKVNIFVGATNSVKSRFMRGLAKSSPYKSIFLNSKSPKPSEIIGLCEQLKKKKFNVDIVINPNGDPNAIRNDIREKVKSKWLANRLERSRKAHEAHWNSTIFSTIGDNFKVLFSDLESDDVEQLRDLEENIDWVRFGLSELDPIDEKWCKIKRKSLTQEIIKDINEIVNFFDTLSTAINLPINRDEPPQIVYVPVLRTATILEGISTGDEHNVDPLANAIIANYDFNRASNKNENSITSKSPVVEVFTGNSLYWIVQKESTGEPAEKRRLKEFERFLEKNFFRDKTVQLSPLNRNHPKGQRLALYINETHDIPIKDWGDGIQAIIVMMYRIFTAVDGAWIFIEEPEQGLHPGLQRIFLDCLSNNEFLRKKDLTIFMTTHSNHLLGVALTELENVSVFAFQERGFPGPFEVRPIFTPEANLLDILGSSNISVFLANCGIWVEGVTDRRYLRAYLAAYLESDEFTSDFEPREDIHYAFFEYAGSNLAHYLFETDAGNSEDIKARFLCNRIFLLADQDKSKESKHERLKKLEDENFVYEVTAGKEVENLISIKQLRLVLPTLIHKLPEADAEKLTLDDYKNKGLGNYLKETLGNKCPKNLVADSGTLNDYYKNKLSFLVSEIASWENMSKDAKALTRKLYDFISKHNQTKRVL